ncbi:MAG: cytochrome c peroxidase [Saprospiraceae bacterium]|nr:c-type cytochrome [Lewinellaceae bacterium]
MKRNPLLAAGTLSALLFFACKKDEPAPTTPPDANTILGKYLNLNLDALPEYAQINYPVHYNPGVLADDNAPSINQVTNSGATLGRVLFYDKNLSRNNTVACASCHDQAKGFTDDLVLSEGFDGGLTGAHSMRLANANFYAGERMFWDKRARDLEEQSTQPIKDHTEMGFDASAGGIDSLIRKLQKLEYYPILFEQAFGSPEISEEKMQRALAQFIRSMVSTDSKFDQGYAQVFNPNAPGGGIGAPFPNFTQQENQGKMLFTAPPNNGGAGCAGCHQPPTFALGANSLSNGLDAGETIIFKAPSLKNIAVAGPYMHDGRFATLAEVVEHYNSGILDGPALDNRLRGPNGQPLRLNLNDAQKQAIVAFLNTLTDNSLLVEARFSDPFK